jgi:TPR repeat protein
MRKSLNRQQVLRALMRLTVLLAAFAYGSSQGQERPAAQGAILNDEAACGTGTNLGNAQACYRLAGRYWEGRGVAQDRMRGALLYQKACERTDLVPRACVLLGELYEKGEVAPKVPQRALFLYRKACDAGEREACARITRLEASLQEQPLQTPPPIAPSKPSTSAPSVAPAPASQATLPAASALPATTRQEPDPKPKQKMSDEEFQRRMANLSKLSPQEADETIREFMRLADEALRLERELKGRDARLFGSGDGSAPSQHPDEHR